MAFWIFKISDQELYPDVLGEKYVYDNTHSIRVKSGDVFLYLDKTKTEAMGISARDRLAELNISWSHVLQRLLA